MRDIVTALQDYAERPIVLRQVPIRDGDRVVGAVDLVSERAWAYREGEPSTLIEIPPGCSTASTRRAAAMLEHLSEFDDTLLEELIEDTEPPSAEVYAICPRVLGENRVIEALIGSGLHGNGIVRVMKALRHEAPAPEVLRARLQQQAGLGGDPLAVIFASAYRKHVGKTLLLRALQPLAAGTPARRPAGGAARPRPTRATAAISTRCPRAPSSAPSSPTTWRPGKLVTPAELRRRARLARAAAGDHAADARADLRARRRQALGRARLDRRGRRGARSSSQDPATGGALVGAQGPLHLRLVRQRLKDVFGMEVEEVVAEPGLPRDDHQAARDRLPPQEADRRRRAVRRREADGWRPATAARASASPRW